MPTNNSITHNTEVVEGKTENKKLESKARNYVNGLLSIAHPMFQEMVEAYIAGATDVLININDHIPKPPE